MIIKSNPHISTWFKTNKMTKIRNVCSFFSISNSFLQYMCYHSRSKKIKIISPYSGKVETRLWMHSETKTTISPNTDCNYLHRPPAPIPKISYSPTYAALLSPKVTSPCICHRTATNGTVLRITQRAIKWIYHIFIMFKNVDQYFLNKPNSKST